MGKKDITFLDFVDGIIANTTINKNGTSVITRFSLNKAEGNENVDSKKIEDLVKNSNLTTKDL